MSASSSTNPPQKLKLQLALDMRWVVIALLVVIIVMLGFWRPWSKPSDGSRTIQVDGEATLTAKPDEYTFTPSYTFENTDKNAALAALNQKSGEITAKLKNLGVSDNQIKTDANGGYMMYAYDDTTKQSTYTLSYTITIDSASLAQKVEDYLVSTTPSGSVTPSVDFSIATRKSLESKARDAATKDARAKGDQMAKNLGFSLGKVKSVDDSAGFGSGSPIIRPMMATGSNLDSSANLQVQPGENDLNYSVTVTYFIN